MIKAIIFDCFGVVRVDATINAYHKLGGDSAKDEQFIRETMAQANAGLINSGEVIADHLGITADEWRETVYTSSEINYKLLDYVKELRKTYKTALLSNIGRGGLDQWFEPGFLQRYFDVIVGSGDIGFAKPEAQSYEITADKLGVRTDQCVMIDDRQELCEGARAVGMQAIFYQGLQQMKKELEAVLSAGPDN